jgi:opacity protein-like surface antigen
MAKSGAERRFTMYMFGVGSVGFFALAYYIWKNSPAERAKGYRENLGPGEWYLGAYTGFSDLPAQDWQFFHSPELQGHTLKNVVYQPGVLGGLKFGRFFDSFPWFGVELETNFSRHAIRGQQVSLSPPLPTGQANLPFPTDRFYIWDMQVNLLVRYGFLKDKEVTFGRLQPYIGIGPGFEVVYGTTDSAKNFAIEAQAGLRYMFSQKLAIFCEYKFSYQFDVEYEQVIINGFKSSTMVFDVPHHRIVLGISYHFKNLYGN